MLRDKTLKNISLIKNKKILTFENRLRIFSVVLIWVRGSSSVVEPLPSKQAVASSNLVSRSVA